MAQLSRPYQILLGVVVVFGLIWAVALRGHAQNPSEPSASTGHPASPANSSAANGTSGANPGASSQIYHGKAPGVEGLTRAIAKAHGVVSESQHNVQEQEGKSQALSGESKSSTTTTRATTASGTAQSVTVTHKTTVAPAPAHKTAKSTHSTTTVTHTTTTVHSTATPVHRVVRSTKKTTVRVHVHPRSSAPSTGRDPEQIAVEHELAQGKTVMLLFWNPKSTVDQEDRTQASALASSSKGTVTLHLALANQVGMFGTITEVVHVYQTPTILIVNKRGLVSTLTGLTDVFALEQALHEARIAVN
jgi:hypothetical protein